MIWKFRYPARLNRRLPLDASPFGITLQWFAPEDEGRTEEPTERKLRKAREDGKVAKSSDLISSLVLIFSITAVGALARYWLDTFQDMLKYYLGLTSEISTLPLKNLFVGILPYFARLSLPIMAVAFFAALVGNIFQVGFLFSTKPITPDFTKILPRFDRWFQRSFVSAEASFNLMKSVVKVGITGVIAFLAIRSNVEELIGLTNGTFLMAIKVVGGIAFRIMLQASIVMLVFSISDYYFQRRQHMQSLKMTRHEVKEERKQVEGDPLVRSRLRERMRLLLTGNMIRRVPEADVVITNPTHFSVALQYRPGESMPAPMVIAKGQDAIAFRIREVATASGVPLMENKPLARALYSEVEIGDVIPERYYEAMARIIKEVYTLQGRSLEEAVG